MAQKYVLYTQEDCSKSGEQFASYYYKIVAGFLEAEEAGAITVAPLFPFAPRNNEILEIDPTQEIEHHIQARYGIDCRTFLDLSGGVACDIDEFIRVSSGRISYSGLEDGSQVWLDTVKRIVYREMSTDYVQFTVDSTSDCVVKPMPGRWDVGKPIMKVFSATNKYKFNMDTPTYLPNIGYTKFAEESKNFLSVHWKRGENLCAVFGQTADDHSIRTDPDRVGESINYLISVNRKANPSNPCDGIFIATDSTSVKDRQRVFDVIRKEWKKIPIYMTPLMNKIEPTERWKYDGADLWLASKGSAFFLSPYSAEDCSIFGRLMMSNARRFNAKMSVTFL